MIIGVCGLIDSGKSTVGDYLVSRYGFERLSFATPLKDMVSSVFGWPRDLLEGDTKESRFFREQKDEFWSERLNCLVTPRNILQFMGTEVMRESFDDNIWLHALERRVKPDTNYVVTDLRFPNEFGVIRKLNGNISMVSRGELPVWWETAKWNPSLMSTNFPDVHLSEWAWVGEQVSCWLDNNGTIKDLEDKIDCMIPLLKALDNSSGKELDKSTHKEYNDSYYT